MNTSRKTALSIYRIFAFMIPLAYIPESYDSVAVKLVLFSALSGALLVLAGIHVWGSRQLPGNLFIIAGASAVAWGVFHSYPGSGSGTIRVVHLLSGAGLFISLGVFRFQIRQILFPLLSGGALAFFLALCFQREHRLAGSFGNPNLAAAYSACLLPLGAYLLQHRNWKKAIAAGLLVLLCALTLAASKTRSSMIAIPLGVGAMALAGWKKQLLLPMAVLVPLCSLLLVHGTIPLPRLEGSMGVRQSIWEGTSEMIDERPVSGWGTGSFQAVFPSFRSPDFALRGVSSNTVHAHSEPGELMAENGIIGISLWTVFWFFLFSTSLKDRNSLTLLAALAGLAVGFIDGSFSVALRWTSQAFLVCSLAAAVVSWKPVQVRRWAAIPLLTGGILLLTYGTGTSLDKARASNLLYQAIQMQNEGGETDSIVRLCQGSLEYDEREPAAWFIMGNQYGIQAECAETPEEMVRLLHMQITVYDSLEARVPDYAWAVQNRASALIRLGEWDQALQELAGILRTRYHLKSWAIENGVLTVPLAADSQALKFACSVYAMILASTLETFQNSEELISAMGTVYAISAVHSPSTVAALDSICMRSFARLDSEVSAELMGRMAREAERAPEDFSALQNYLHGVPCPWPEIPRDVHASYLNLLLCHMAADSGRGEYLETALRRAELLHNSCYFLGNRFPGGEFTLVAPVLIAISSSDCDLDEVMGLCLRYILEINSYGERVRIRSLIARKPAGGAGTVYVSPFELLALAPEVSFELHVTVEFIQAALEASIPGSERDAVTGRFLEFARELKAAMDPDAAMQILTTVTANEVRYLENGPFDPSVSASARALREALLR